MSETEFAAYQAEVITADMQRTYQAGWLAECEPGPAPDATRNREAFMDYLAKYNELASQILGRLN